MRRERGYVLAFKQHAAGSREQTAGDDIEERRFAGAIGSDETGDLALGDGKADIIDSKEAAKAHDDVFESDHEPS